MGGFTAIGRCCSRHHSSTSYASVKGWKEGMNDGANNTAQSLPKFNTDPDQMTSLFLIFTMAVKCDGLHHSSLHEEGQNDLDPSGSTRMGCPHDTRGWVDRYTSLSIHLHLYFHVSWYFPCPFLCCCLHTFLDGMWTTVMLREGLQPMSMSTSNSMENGQSSLQRFDWLILVPAKSICLKLLHWPELRTGKIFPLLKKKVWLDCSKLYAIAACPDRA